MKENKKRLEEIIRGVIEHAEHVNKIYDKLELECNIKGTTEGKTAHFKTFTFIIYENK